MGRTKIVPVKSRGPRPRVQLALKRRPGFVETHGRQRVPHRYRPGTVALREIRRYQRGTGALIKRLPFQRVVREILARVSGYGKQGGLRVQPGTFSALQEAAEAFIVETFENAYLCSLHAGRVTLQPRDLFLAIRIRGDRCMRGYF